MFRENKASFFRQKQYVGLLWLNKQKLTFFNLQVILFIHTETLLIAYPWYDKDKEERYFPSKCRNNVILTYS